MTASSTALPPPLFERASQRMPQQFPISQEAESVAEILFPVASFGSNLKEILPQIFSELERRFFIPQDKLEKRVDLSKLPRVRYEQSYFSEEVAQQIGKLTLGNPELNTFLGRLNITQARLRKITDGNEINYQLEIKARDPKGPKIENKEFSPKLNIGKELYDELLESVVGTVCKDRYFLRGKTVEPDGSKGKRFTVEIDLPLWRKTEGRRESLKDLNLAFLEVESQDLELLQRIQDGDHNVGVLHRSLEISRDVKASKLRSPLSWKRVAVENTYELLARSAKALQKAWRKQD